MLNVCKCTRLKIGAATSHNSDFTTQESWDGGGHTTETSSNYTAWYDSGSNPDDLPKSHTFGSEKSTNDDVNQYKGTFYNWLVATAGKGQHSTAQNDVVDDSICPRGWRLPTGKLASEDKSWAKLLQYAGSSADGVSWSATARTYPYSFVRVGIIYYTTGAPGNTGNVYLWASSVASSSANALNLNMDNNMVYDLNNSNKGYGFPVRCVNR